LSALSTLLACPAHSARPAHSACPAHLACPAHSGRSVHLFLTLISKKSLQK
ncbi:2856_t:CDS:1, partial [Gigaspora margarita]